MLAATLAYRRYAADPGAELARAAATPATAREIAYWRDHIGAVRDAAGLVADRRLLAFAMRAHGLGDLGAAGGLARKLIESADEGNSLAGRLVDPRYRAFAAALSWLGAADAPAPPGASEAVVSAYARQALEENAGRNDEALRLALYFHRKAPGLASAMSILADKALLKVTQVALGLPAAIGSAPIDRQQAAIEARLDVSDLRDGKKLDAFLQRFLAVNSATSGVRRASAAPAVALLADGAIGADALLSLARLRAGG